MAIEVPIRPSYTSSFSTSFFTYIDICYAYTVEDSFETYHKKLIFFGNPIRVVVTKNVTNKEVHRAVWGCARRSVCAEARERYRSDERAQEEDDNEVHDDAYLV